MGLLNLIDRKQHHTRQLEKAYSNFTYTINSSGFLSLEDNSSTYINEGYKGIPNLYGIISLIIQKSILPPPQFLKVKNRQKFREYKSRLKALNFPAGDKNASSKFNSQLKKLYLAKQEAFEEVNNSDLERLFDKPNASQSIEELYEAHDGYLLLTGNSYFKAETPGAGKNAKKPTELFVVPSPACEPIAKGMEIDRYKISYYAEEIPKELIGHTKYFNPISGGESAANGLKGMSPLMACRKLIAKNRAADIAQGSMFTNMAPAGILTGGEDGVLTEEQAIAIKDRFKQFHTGPAKAGDIVVTPAKLKWEQIGFTPVDMNIIEGKKEMLGEYCNVYHVPIGMFTDNNSTDNNMTNSRIMFVTDAVIPTVEKRKHTINNWLAPMFGDDIYLEYDYSVFPEMQEDLKEQAETAERMYWISPNEKREMTTYDVHPNPKMNDIYFPAGLVPIDEMSLEADEIDEEELRDNDALNS